MAGILDSIIVYFRMEIYKEIFPLGIGETYPLHIP